MKRQYIYPQNMRTKAKLWFWQFRDLIILGVSLTIAVILWAKVGFVLPAVLTALYGFLTMRYDDFSVLDYLKRAWNYFIASQQYFEWKEKNEE